MPAGFRNLRSDKAVSALRLLLAAATACAWMIAAALKPLLTPQGNTGLPAQSSAWTLTAIDPESQEVQSRFGLAALDGLLDWARREQGRAACGHVATEFATNAGERIPARQVSAGCLTALGAPVIRGRLWTEREHDRGTDAQACLVSERLVLRHGGALAVGDVLHGTTASCTVIGVVARSVVGFTPEDRVDDLWLPLEASPGFSYHQLSELGRTSMLRMTAIRPADDGETAPADVLDAILRHAGALEAGHRVVLEPGIAVDMERVHLVDRMQSTALLIALALFVATVGNSILLTESVLSARRHSLAVRTAVGASPIRLLREILADSAVVATAGAVIGVAGAWGLLRLVAAKIDASWTGTGTAAPLVVPALVAFAVTLGQLLVATLVAAPRHIGLGTPITRSGLARSPSSTFVRWMVGLQLMAAAAVVMITAATVERFSRLLPADPGLASNDVTFVWIRDTRFRLLSSDARIDPLVAEVLARLRGMPEVAAATTASMQPIGNDETIGRLQLPGMDRPLDVRYVQVGDRYATTLGLSIVRGSRQDLDEIRPGTAFVDDALVRKLGDRMPEELTFTTGIGATRTTRFQVRGVTRRVIHDTTRGPRGNMFWQPDAGAAGTGGEFPTVYLPFDGCSDPVFIVRAAAPPAEVARRVGALWSEVSPTGTVSSFTSASDALEPLIGKDRMIGALFTLGSAALLVIVAAAMFGTIAVSLAARQQRAAIELALGAVPHRLTLRELRRAVLASVVASLLALPIALLAVAFLGDALPMDAAETTHAFALATIVLATVTVLAVLPLSIRIGRTPPNVLLRT